MSILNTPNEGKNGFTLVELSIVMIIIGLLIGGVLGGMRLVDNANVQKTIQDLKAIESSALTFRDTYGRLPGDIRNPSSRLPNCTTAPCSTSGDGNRNIGVNGISAVWTSPIAVTDENFTFWHHLQAANLLQMDYRNTTDMEFGEGQPSSPLGLGYRTSIINGPVWTTTPPSNNFRGTIIVAIQAPASGDFNSYTPSLSCALIRQIDINIDDGSPISGKFMPRDCNAGGWPPTLTTTYDITRIGSFIYDLQGF